ncbi:glycosyltransferase [Georgenia sp. SYP-B2076]|uniref:glycosyltransferase n=1 Tax=Georgenia sp. SYP-B2076 TaxID=2495881 RepID=UPI00197ABB79|nr:glycosyltransferase [Georgenia sp. SYP-B2076]
MTEPFSVLLPVYRGDTAAHFERAVRSVTVDQVLRPSELVVVRDGPVGPALAAVLEALVSGAATSPAGDVPVTILQLGRNQGLARALERGLAACAHEIVARADADDISLPDRFATQIPLVVGGLDLLGSAITEFEDDEACRGLTRVLPERADDIAATARFRDPFNHPSVVYRRAAVQRAGGYRHLDLMEDYWLFARMIAAGARVGNVSQPLVLYRVGAGAYRRRGGWKLLRSEVALQRRFRAAGFTTTAQFVRNVAVRGGYRFVPELVRKVAYRRMVG